MDWLNGKLSVERGIVRQNVGRCENHVTQGNQRPPIADARSAETWKQTTQFSAQEDWIFASPRSSAGCRGPPISVCECTRKPHQTLESALGTHSMRHTYRSWLDAVGTPIAVQQKLMRHADIRTTMNTYGDVVTDEMTQAASKVAGLAVNGM